MKNITCDIIEDLLPLYHDNVCSNDSKIIVEEHLKNCPQCKSCLACIHMNAPATASITTAHNIETTEITIPLFFNFLLNVFNALTFS